MVLPSSYRDSGTKWVNKPLEILNFDQINYFSEFECKIWIHSVALFKSIFMIMTNLTH